MISLIAKKPIGVLHLLDDESNFPKATDASFLEKCHYNHALNELYFRPRMSSMEFGIKHYAGQVWYNADGFLDKNRDTLRPDVVDLLISSRIQVGICNLTRATGTLKKFCFADDFENVPGYEKCPRIGQNSKPWRRTFRYHETQDGHSSCPFPRFAPSSARVHVQVLHSTLLFF